MKQLHQNQQGLLDLLKTHAEAPLTMAELMEELNVSSTSVVHHHILQLERKGYLKRNPSNPRDYQLLSEPDKPIVYLNFYGHAQCGPNGTLLDGNPEDRIPIASRLLKFPATEGFMVKAKGNSMSPVIEAGDLVIAQQAATASNGETIICTNSGETMIKIYQRDNSTVILNSANSLQYGPFVAAADFRIVGILRNVIKYQ
jgi:repressor LexA